MPYEIPKSLQYHEKIIFNLTLFQLSCLFITALPIGLIWIKLQIPELLKFILTIILVGLGIGFSFLDFNEWIKKLAEYHKSNQKIKKYPNTLHWTTVLSINEDAIFLKDGSARSVLKIKPIEFQWLNEYNKENIIQGFRSFIQSLDFPIQLCMRTTNFNPNDYLKELNQPTNNQNNARISYFQHLKDYLNDLAVNRRIKQREFYLVIPSQNINYNPIELFSFHEKNVSKEITDSLYYRTQFCEQKLSSFGISSRRLLTKELQFLINNYFSNEPMINYE